MAPGLRLGAWGISSRLPPLTSNAGYLLSATTPDLGRGVAPLGRSVGKTTRPFRYDLNQIPYDYTVEVRNRFKGLDLIRLPDELWTEVRDIVHETGVKTIYMEKKCIKAQWLSGEALQIAMKRREVKNKGEKERHKHLNAEFERIARKDKKAFHRDQGKEIEENNRM